MDNKAQLRKYWLVFVVMFVVVALTFSGGSQAEMVQIGEQAVEKSNAHSLFPEPGDVTLLSTFDYVDDEFVFNDSEITLKLVPVIEDDKGKAKLKDKTDKEYQNKTYRIEKLNKKYKYSLDLSKVEKVKKDKIQKVYFDIEWNYSWDIHIEDNTTFRFGPEHSSGLYEMNFTDLVELGYDVKIYNRTVEISNLVGRDLDLDPTVTFSELKIRCVSMDFYNDNEFILGFCDDTNYDMSFIIYNTTGSTVVGVTDVDTTITIGGTDTYSVSVAAMNSSVFVISWFDHAEEDATFAIYWTNGSLKSGPTDADTTVGVASYSVQVAALNETDFVVVWADDADSDVSYSIYNTWGTLKAGPVDVDVDIGGDSKATPVAALNSTHFVIGWYDDTDKDTTFVVKDYLGNTITGPTDLDTTSGENTFAIDVAAFNSTDFVVVAPDLTDQDTSYSIYNTWGTQKVGFSDIDTSSGSDARAVGAATIDSENVVLTWYDSDGTDHSFATIKYDNTTITAATELTSTVYVKTLGIASYEPATNLGPCGDNFVVAYANASNIAIWETFNMNGSRWNGVCPSTDSCSPTANANWALTGSDNCTKSNKDLAVANITMTTPGWLYLINTNITTTELRLCSGCNISIDSNSKVNIG